MCGRFILAQRIEKLAERFNVRLPVGFEFDAGYNIGPGSYSPVIASNIPDELQLFRFGMTPFWAKKAMYLFNARAEGARNKENSPEYKGSKDIINKPAFRKPIRSQRCLIPADAFIEGTTTEGLSNPYVVYLRDKVRPFAFAGIWDQWTNKEDGQEVFSYSIITTAANELIQKIPHHRCPVILHQNDELKWLNPETPLSRITQLLKPYNAELMNAYPIANTIKNPKAQGKKLIDPIGEPIVAKEKSTIADRIEKRGFGRRKIH